jgi:tetratricopeptide (TPR) repeat protein
VSDDLLGGIGGNDSRASEPPGTEGPLSAGAFAASLAAHHIGLNPAAADAATQFLRDQSRLLEEQAAELKEERVVRLALLRAQLWEAGIRRLTMRVRLATQIVLAIAAGTLGTLAASMIYGALTSNSVIVNAFRAPASLAARGLTGDVVAVGVLDALQTLQAATRSATAGLRTVSAWSSDIKIQLPDTGVSIGELDRLMHERFGHDIHIDGDLVQRETGALALTVRGEGVPAKRFEGPPGDLGKLTTEAAEYIYGRSQPFQYAVYLSGQGRDDDALAFLPGGFARAGTNEARAQLANVWGLTYLDQAKFAQAGAKFRLAMSLKPNYWRAWANLIGAVQGSNGEEAAWQESRAMLHAVNAVSLGDRPDLRIIGNAASVTLDLPLLLASNLDEGKLNGGAGSSVDGTIAVSIADDYGLMHDPVQAARYMAASDPDDPAAKAGALMLEAYAGLDRGDPAGSVAPLEKYWVAWQASTDLQSSAPDYPCFLGLAYGLSGRMEQAEKVFARTGRWSRCFAFHGYVLARTGDIAAARRVWVEGLQAAPDLPHVYLSRGADALARGDAPSAATDFATAHDKAAHWADPLKAWGDALAKQGHWAEALAKYDDALKYAPNWDALKQARDSAVRKN